MVVFVDTSALLAVLDEDEERHARARLVWNDLLRGNSGLLTTNYVLLESAALIQRRLGLAALRALHERIAPLLTVEWTSAEEHTQGMEATLIAGRRSLSLVDCLSFLTMRRRRVTTAFAFDAHFREQGFDVIPPATSSPA